VSLAVNILPTLPKKHLLCHAAACPLAARAKEFIMQPTRNFLTQMRRALCHSHLRGDDGKQCTNNVHTDIDCTMLVQSMSVCRFGALVPVPCKTQSPLRAQTLKPEIRLATIRSLTALVLVLMGMGLAHSQAPIRERSEAVSGIDGARRAADAARNGLVAADSRHAEATARVKKAEDGLLAAQKEIDAARTEKAAADRAQKAAGHADDQARAALARALDARK